MQNPFKRLRDQLNSKTGEQHSQHDVAVMLGMTANAVGQWERAQNAPHLQHAPKIAEVFRVTLEEAEQAIVTLNRIISAAQKKRGRGKLVTSSR